ncbi:unnamed protein product [Adineta ricciae]|uniref:Uncharacterized protein n=1 Tax=Adineta ricciae TaxID=249248 RepID=A0A815V738_ADIRI|nr:unnamed protein product [Adineta ricciae]
MKSISVCSVLFFIIIVHNTQAKWQRTYNDIVPAEKGAYDRTDRLVLSDIVAVESSARNQLNAQNRLIVGEIVAAKLNDQNEGDQQSQWILHNVVAAHLNHESQFNGERKVKLYDIAAN